MSEFDGTLSKVGADRERLAALDGVRLTSADVVVASTNHAIADGAVAWHGNTVAAVGSREELRDTFPRATVAAHPGRAIIPSFINAHTHVCLSFLEGKAPYNGDFAAWLQTVLQSYLEWTEEDHANSLSSGLRQAICHGTAAVGDIINDWSARPAYRNAAIGGILFLQVTGFNPVVSDVWMHNLHQVFDVPGARDEFANIRLGISPHAPYTTSAGLYRGCFELAEKHDLLVMTHLAETPQEEQFLRTGTGIYRRMLRERGTWVAKWKPPNLSPVQYMEAEGLLNSRGLYAHVNYPSDTDLDILARTGANVVYCPKSHAFFEHPPHRMDEMIEGGIPVSLGTDGLSSNDSLSMLEEVKLVRQRFPRLPATTIFEAGTVRGAEALRCTDEYGTLGPGRKASFSVLDLGEPPDAERIFDQLLAPPSRVTGVIAWGRKVR